MKPREIFAVAVRSTGLIVSLNGGAIVFWGLMSLVLGGPSSAGGLMIIGVPILLVGLWLLRGAPDLIAFAYPEKDQHE